MPVPPDAEPCASRGDIIPLTTSLEQEKKGKENLKINLSSDVQSL